MEKFEELPPIARKIRARKWAMDALLDGNIEYAVQCAAESTQAELEMAQQRLSRLAAASRRLNEVSKI